MQNKNILISGAGIAGITLAYWLKKYGFNPTIIEHAPTLREGGYMIDFFGAGVDVAERMGMLPDLEEQDLRIAEITFVDENNERVGGLDTTRIRSLMNNRIYSLLRSDLARIIYNRTEGDIELVFARSIQAVEQDEREVRVVLTDGSSRVFDLLIGADGLHSNVRRLVFGDESLFEKYYGYYTSSYTIDNYLETNPSYLSYTIPGKQTGIYSPRSGKLTTFFIFASAQKLDYDHHDIAAQKSILRAEYAGAGWECAALLDRIDSAPDFYFDSVSQVRMDRWSEGRVTLVGDACDCPSLLSGQGSTLAMVGAYILAGELKAAGGDHQHAFKEYESVFKPFMHGKQQLAQRFAGSFVPTSKRRLWMRNAFTRLMFIPLLSRWLVKQFMTDAITLRVY